MDVILALGAEIRKMFAGDALLSLATVLFVAVLGLLVRVGVLGPDLAPWLLMFGVAIILVASVNLWIVRNLRKTAK